MTRALPNLEMALLRDQGMSWDAIGRRYGVCGHTVRTRIAGVIPSRLPRVTLPAEPERAFAARMAGTPARFNDPITATDARSLRELAGWPKLTPENGDDECGD
ncbi:MAG: hypothetical protein IT518_09030 [Burkholderiales bacterium]|nr:hypothetical protein [Burkholderiales bacterium]